MLCSQFHRFKVFKHLYSICTEMFVTKGWKKTTHNAHLPSGHNERVQVIWSIKTSSSHNEFQTERNVLASTRYKQELVRRQSRIHKAS